MATARQVEGEFQAQAGPSSTWRWFAKKVAENKFQMKFSTAKKVEELAFFTGMQMGTVPGVTFKVEPWNPYAGAKAKLDAAWFRISGIPLEKRTEKRACYVASLVGIPLEVDKPNIKKWEYVRVKIGCRDITKVPAVVEGLLDLHFFDFTFQREVPSEQHTRPGWNTWNRSTDRGEDDNPSPKKPRREEGKGYQGNHKRTNDFEAGTSNHSQKQNEAEAEEKTQEGNETEDTEIGGKEKEKVAEGNVESSKQGKMQIDSSQEKGTQSSEDSGRLCFDDCLSPGGEHFGFGTI